MLNVPRWFKLWRKSKQATKRVSKNTSKNMEHVRAYAAERVFRTVDKDDILLNQIDEFREKARQLQEMLYSKESRAEELEAIVRERENIAGELEIKTNELQVLLDERQAEASDLTLRVEKEIDVLIDKVSVKMQEIESSMGAKIDRIANVCSTEAANSRNAITGDINNLGVNLLNGVGGIEQRIGSKLSEQNFSEEQASQMKAAVSSANEQLLDALEELNEELDVLKSELSEKIHSENVRLFRNVQDSIKDLDDQQFETANLLTQEKKKSKRIAVVTLVICLINTLGLVGIALFTMGIL